MRQALKGLGGDMMEKVGMAGLPGIIGFDWSKSINPINLPINPFLAVVSPTKALKISQGVMSVYTGLIDKGTRAIENSLRGNYMKALEAGSPVAAENILKGVRMTTGVVTSERGKVRFDEDGKPLQLTTFEGVGQAAGFKSYRVAKSSEQEREHKDIQAHYTEMRSALMDQYAIAKTPDDKAAAMKAIKQYNEDLPKRYRGIVPLITFNTIHQAIKSRTQPNKKLLKFERKPL
jgi:hypothetical protein